MPRLCELYPGICLTTEEKARKNLSQGSWRMPYFNIMPSDRNSSQLKFCRHAHPISSSLLWSPQYFSRVQIVGFSFLTLRSWRASLKMLIILSLTFKNRASYIQDGRTATLQMLHFIYIFSTNISTEYFKHAAHSPFFSSKCRLFHNSTFFGSCIIHILHTGCAKI